MSFKLFSIAIFIVLIIIVAVWYFYSNFSQQTQQGYNIEEGQNVGLGERTASDSTSNISNDFKRIPDDSAVKNGIDLLNQDISTF